MFAYLHIRSKELSCALRRDSLLKGSVPFPTFALPLLAADCFEALTFSTEFVEGRRESTPEWKKTP